jgi:hypothetical protein
MTRRNTVKSDFDQIAAVEAGDEQRVERFVDRALAERWRRRQRLFGPGRISPWMTAAAVLAVCGVAFGVRGVWWPQRASAPAVSTVPQSPAPARLKPRPVRPPRAVTEPTDEPSAATNNQNHIEPSSPPPSAGPAAPLNSTGVPAIRKPPSVVPMPTSARAPLEVPEPKGSVATFATEQPSESNAGTLLRQANRARSLGELDRAVSLLNELQSKFPGSAQAHVSLVSLGKLLMQRGMTRLCSYFRATSQRRVRSKRKHWLGAPRRWPRSGVRSRSAVHGKDCSRVFQDLFMPARHGNA